MKSFALLALLAACAAPAADPAADATAHAGETFDDVAAKARVCADGPTVLGIDVSFYQESIDWPRVRAAGVEFAFVRVSDGLGFPDRRFAENWRGARQAGIRRGAYQFFRPAQDPVAQADLLLDAIGELAPGDLPPVIDVEATGDLAPGAIVERMQRWIDRVTAATGMTPIVYTGQYFWQDEVGSSQFADHPLWLAQYTSQCPEPPAPWRRWAFWQYSDRGRIAGVSGDVDVNRFNGSREDLALLGRPDDAAPIEVSWVRATDGVYTFRALPAVAADAVELAVDGYPIGTASRGADGAFALRYHFTVERAERRLTATARAAGVVVARGDGLLDVGEATGVFVRPTGAREYEIGLERAVAEVAAIEVRADGVLLRDGVSGATRSPRRAVRSAFTRRGERELAITTYDAAGRVRGTLRRRFAIR